MKRASLPSRADIARVFLLVAAVFGAGCGYHFAASGSGLPANATTIYVAKFRNYSRQTGIQEEFARYLKDEVANHKRLVLVDDPASADLRLSGVIRGIETYPAAFNAVSEPSSYNFTMAVDARLVDRSGKVIWSARGLSEQKEFATVPNAVVVTSPKFLQQNLRSRDIEALPNAQLARTQQEAVGGQALASLARDLYSSMSGGF